MCFKGENKVKQRILPKTKGKISHKKGCKKFENFVFENYNIKPFQRTFERFRVTHTHAYGNPFVKTRLKVLLELPLELYK